MQATQKSLDIVRDRQKNIQKQRKKNENWETTKKKSNNTNKHFFTCTFLYRKNYILLEHIFGKADFILLHMYYSVTYVNSNKTPAPTDMHWSCRRKILGNRLGMLT